MKGINASTGRLTTKRGRVGKILVAGVAIICAASVTKTASMQTASRQTASTTASDCAPPAPGAPMLVTADCVDPRFNDPSIDIDEMRNTPVPHRYVHGGFTGTGARFSFYFPPNEQYRGRFFQPTHQLQTSENAAPGNISFAVASGAYWVQTNMGGSENPTTAALTLSGKFDPAIRGYRVNAAAAKHSRIVAARMYGAHRTYGYLHGGSGGAYQTITSAEHTAGVWDGFVPYVMGTPNAIPGNFTVRIHALRVLKQRNKFPAILDAVDPGGSGDPYAGLNDEERGALDEATRMGFPPRGWWNHATLTGGPLRLVADYVPLLDPMYVSDFWSKPGYLGTDPKSSVSAARIVHATKVTGKVTGPNRLVLASMPTGDLTGIDLVVKTGAAAGKEISAPAIDTAARTVTVVGGSAPLYNSVQIGDDVTLDNSQHLALQTFHRHNVPPPDMYGWNQFRRRDGTPIYPQRAVLVGPIGAANGTGAVNNGRFRGKMILLQSLMDIDALPWQADWYRKKAEEALGPKQLAGNFRLWFTDHAQHGAPAGAAAELRTVSYQGVVQQALRDVSAWVERGVEPPASTSYKVVDAQVEVPTKADSRKGIQPVVELTVNSRARADVAVGQPVTFSATIEVPPDTGNVVAVEWNYEGAGSYVPAELGDIRSAVSVTATHTYSQPGTYFPVLRVTSQREGDRRTAFGRVQNLGRARVVVKPAAAAQKHAMPALSTPPAIAEIAANRAQQLAAAGYVEQEFFLEGTARAYSTRGEWTSDGMWDVAVGEAAPYKIRILARYPKQARRFNGVVFVEWLNVSGQGEADPNFTVLQGELLRDGYGYLGVGAQAAGIYGASGLKKVNAGRYDSLSHPGDSFSYDIYSQAGQIIRSPNGPLGPLTARIRSLLADGESQSANRLVTYVNAIHPQARVFDGFFIHSRVGSGGAPLTQGAANGPAARIRMDLNEPVFVIQTEGDIPNFAAARQPDTDRLRIWELAGTAHADRYLLTGGGSRPMAANCDEKDPKLNVPVNDGPMTYPMRAALRHMKRWLAGGAPPPSGTPLLIDGSTIRRDPITAIALGGVRTPQVDVPTRTLHGIRAPAGGGQFCFLFGRTDEWNGDADPWDGGPADPSPTPEPVLSRLYPTKADYIARFELAIAKGVKAGFLLKEDVESLRAEGARVQF